MALTGGSDGGEEQGVGHPLEAGGGGDGRLRGGRRGAMRLPWRVPLRKSKKSEGWVGDQAFRLTGNRGGG